MTAGDIWCQWRAGRHYDWRLQHKARASGNPTIGHAIHSNSSGEYGHSTCTLSPYDTPRLLQGGPLPSAHGGAHCGNRVTPRPVTLPVAVTTHSDSDTGQQHFVSRTLLGLNCRNRHVAFKCEVDCDRAAAHAATMTHWQPSQSLFALVPGLAHSPSLPVHRHTPCTRPRRVSPGHPTMKSSATSAAVLQKQQQQLQQRRQQEAGSEPRQIHPKQRQRCLQRQ
jgi:hypothetical protein